VLAAHAGATTGHHHSFPVNESTANTSDGDAAHGGVAPSEQDDGQGGEQAGQPGAAPMMVKKRPMADQARAWVAITTRTTSTMTWAAMKTSRPSRFQHDYLGREWGSGPRKG
jgi:hypothetical protein